MAWRGNNLLPHTHGMDVISRHYIESEGLKFVDTRGIMEYFKADIATGVSSQHPSLVQYSSTGWLALADLGGPPQMCTPAQRVLELSAT